MTPYLESPTTFSYSLYNFHEPTMTISRGGPWICVRKGVASPLPSPCLLSRSLFFPSLPCFPLISPALLPSPSLPSPPFRSTWALKPARGSGERWRLSQRGRDEAPAENEFGALWSCEKATDGSHFEYSDVHVLQ